MGRLLKLEFLKLRHFKAFWYLLLGYAVVVIGVCCSGKAITNFLKNEGAEFNGISPAIIPLYDFPDVWQNMAYIAGYIKVLLAFIVIISISNEFNFRLLRQNVIDGLSKKEWLGSKLLLIGVLSLGATALLFLTGLVMGLIYSHPDGMQYLFSEMDIVAAYFLEIFTYLSFALMLSLVIRKSGILIVGLIMYSMIFEPLLTFFLLDYPDLSDGWRFLAGFFPVRSIMNLIHPPFPRYAFYEIQDYISLKELSIVLGWLAFYLGISYWILKRKDL